MTKKKDPNYIVKIEQAIQKKYGNEAVQNPKKFWNKEKEDDYLTQIEELAQKQNTIAEKTEKIEVDGFLISKKLLNRESNRKCPVCGIYSFDGRDDVYMNKFNCCHDCYIKWVEFREERWLSGWRPNEGE
jgi:hypothetical protein|tara:strand:- start:148 stop:537 length:390 start_codon:yes stop_codon:yes gene_type:complete